MRTNALLMQLLRVAALLVAVLCIVAAAPLGAQQASDSARVATVVAAPSSSPGTALAGPRSSPPQFQPFRPSLSPTNAPVNAARAAGGGGSSTVVISGLTLVLIIIIVVLLVR
jgi:hypothetical protein